MVLDISKNLWAVIECSYPLTTGPWRTPPLDPCLTRAAPYSKLTPPNPPCTLLPNRNPRTPPPMADPALRACPVSRRWGRVVCPGGEIPPGGASYVGLGSRRTPHLVIVSS